MAIETKNELRQVRDTYDATAKRYAEEFLRELETKPLDRALLDVLVEDARVRGGTILDVGTGSGQVARYMSDRGVPVIGIDVSPNMIEVARQHHPRVELRVGDMFALDLEDRSCGAVTAFYAIVHLTRLELDSVFRELHRVLAADGALLVAFHAGEETLVLSEFLGERVELAWNFFPMAVIVASLESAGFRVEARLERQAYSSEHPTTRGYVLARRPAT